MEIILKKDVANLGFKDEIVTVKPGYGRNFLIPQGMASLATPSAKKVLAEDLKQKAVKDAKAIAAANDMVAKMAEATITVPAKAGEKGKIFGSVTNVQLAESMNKLGFELDRKNIKILGGTIKNLGKFEAEIRIHREVSTKIGFEVVAE